MNIPARLIKFWYPNALEVFLRSWHNLMNLLEEDLAVGLMFKLLFVPLFHDSSFVGKGLSFCFRSIRIFMGLIAFALISLLLFLLALLWFAAPLGILIAFFFFKQLVLVFGVLLLVGVSLFIQHLLANQPKKVWYIKSLDQIWEATRLKKTKISFDSLTSTLEVQNLLKSLETSAEHFSVLKPQFSDQVLEMALKLAQQNQATEITADYFWLGFLKETPDLENFLLSLNLAWVDFEQAILLQEFKRNHWRKVMIWDEDFSVKHLRGVNRGWLGSPTPNLDKYGEDLTKIAAKQAVVDFTGREAVISNVVRILSQDHDRNVLLVGSPGVGKTTLVNYLAKLIIAGDAPESLATKRLVKLDTTKLLSSLSSEGDLASRLKDIFEEIGFAQNVILFIDEIHTLGIGEAGQSMNLYSLMQPYLESDKFQFLASTEPQNYAQVIEKNGTFARIFHKVEIPIATPEETQQVLFKKAVDLASQKRIMVSFLAIKKILELSTRLIHDRVLPDSALTILNECEPLARNGLISSETVKEVVGRNIKVPILEVDAAQKLVLLNLENIIHQKMIDQEEAVRAVADTLRRASTSLREQNRPIGSFLFVGPTGVGKTELAKVLSEVYFKNQDAFEHFDMSEFQTDQAVDRLLGTASTLGELTELIKNKPYCLLLLDEFEKANPRILTLFLQVLEEGRLTDFSGREIDFSNTIIIATSNAASLQIAQGLQSGHTVEQITPNVKDELLKILKVELVNRFDRVVIFKPLSEVDLEKIVQIKLTILQQQLKAQGYLVEFSSEIVAEIVKKGFDPVLGARPMRRLIQDSLEANLSKLILEGKLQKGVKLKLDNHLLI